MRLCRFPPPIASSFSFATSADLVHRPAIGRVGAATIIEFGGRSCHRSRPWSPDSGSDDTNSACVATNLFRINRSAPADDAPVFLNPLFCDALFLTPYMSVSFAFDSIASKPPREFRSHARSPGIGPRWKYSDGGSSSSLLRYRVAITVSPSVSATFNELRGGARGWG